MTLTKNQKANKVTRRVSIPPDVRLLSWLKRHRLKAPEFRISPDEEALLKAEIEARWPYYLGNKEYLQFAEQNKDLAALYLSLINQAAKKDSRTAAENESAFHALDVETNKLRARMDVLQDQCEAKFGLTMIIPSSFSTAQILTDRYLCFCFLRRDPSVSCDLQPKDLESWAQNKQSSKSLADLWSMVDVPIRLRITRSKPEILRAVGKLVDEWQAVWAKIYAANKSSLPLRDRKPDTSLFLLYVKAVNLSEKGLELKEISVELWPNEKTTSTDALTARAKLYVDNGRLLLGGKSDEIGQKMPKT